MPHSGEGLLARGEGSPAWPVRKGLRVLCPARRRRSWSAVSPGGRAPLPFSEVAQSDSALGTVFTEQSEKPRKSGIKPYDRALPVDLPFAAHHPSLARDPSSNFAPMSQEDLQQFLSALREDSRLQEKLRQAGAGLPSPSSGRPALPSPALNASVPRPPTSRPSAMRNSKRRREGPAAPSTRVFSAMTRIPGPCSAPEPRLRAGPTFPHRGAIEPL